MLSQRMHVRTDSRLGLTMKPWRSRHGVLCVLAAWLSVVCLSAMAKASSPPGQVPHCQLKVIGGQDGHIAAADMRCFGRGQADIALDQALLGTFQASFAGMRAQPSCQPRPKCLVTACNGSVVLRGSSISGVNISSLTNLVCVVAASTLEVQNSQFVYNSARAVACFDQSHTTLHGTAVSHNVVQQGSGGGLCAEGGSTVLITSDSRVGNNTASEFGGGVIAWDGANVTISAGSSVHDNVAEGRSGGGVAVFDDASLVVAGRSRVHHNTALRSGGGVFARNRSIVVITNGSAVDGNAARNASGGGVSAIDNAIVMLTGASSVHGNAAHAFSGGGVFAYGNSSVALTDASSVHSNTASLLGGGLAAWGNVNVTVTGGSSLHSNTARNGSGGGLTASGNVSVTLVGGSSVYNNAAHDVGGGVFAGEHAVVAVTEGSNVHGNIAHQHGGGLAATGNVVVTVTGASSLHNNVARNGSGGGLSATANASVTFVGGSSVYNNTAFEHGGGLYAEKNAIVALAKGSSVHGNSADYGGGLVAHGNVNVTVTGASSLHKNTARNGSGGGVAASGNVSLTLVGGSSVYNNTAHIVGGGMVADDNASVALTEGSSVHGNIAHQHGGGVYALQNASVALTDASSVHNNIAHQYGGGLGVEGNAIVTVTGASSLHSNTARNGSGGGVAAVGNASVTFVGGSSVCNNTAHIVGGGMVADDNASVALTDASSVHKNTASEFGGGVAAWGGANVTISARTSVHDNVAQGRNGGGVAVMGTASLAIAGRSRVHHNTALYSGGGVHAGNRSIVVITNGSAVDGNAARNSFGGAVPAFHNAIVTLTGASSVHGNAARKASGGGVVAVDNAIVMLTGACSVHGNAARNASGGGVLALDNAIVMLTGASSVHGNSAHSGGGLWAQDSANVTVTGASSLHSNIAVDGSGGGLVAGGNVSVRLAGGSSVYNNTARGVGGGVILAFNATLTLSGNSSLHQNQAQHGGGAYAEGNASVLMSNLSQVHHNTAYNGSGGGLYLRDRVFAVINGSCAILKNSAQGVGGGVAVGMSTSGITFGDKGLRRIVEGLPTLEDPFAGEYCVANWSTAHVMISNNAIANNTSYRSAGGGLAVASNGTIVLTAGTQIVGNHAINSSGGGVVLIDFGTLQADSTVVFADNVVNRGYVGSMIAALDSSNLQLSSRGALTKCNPGVYLGRLPCGEGETLLHDICTCCPRHTYSFDGTPQCTACPSNGNCLGGSLVEPIAGYWHSSGRSTEMHRCPLSTVPCNHTVTPSDIVQACNPGYKGNLCGACQLPEYGMVSPLKCGKCMRPQLQLGLYLLACCITVVFIAFTVHATWQDNLKGGQAVRATDVIKVVVQFLQYLVIIGSVSIPWSAGMNLQRWLQVASSVFGAASGEALSLDCWLHHYVSHVALHLSIQRQLVYLLAPVGVLVAVVLLQCLVWAVQKWVVPLLCRLKAREPGGKPSGAFLVLRRLPVTVLVVTYYAYPTLLRASLGFFACLRIDRLASKPDSPITLNHARGYWVSDIQQACFTGYHLGWALGLGLPSVLLWCIVVPVSLGLGLRLCRAKANADGFREYFGFLYRNYRPERIWWEAVWAARTVLTLVSVFSFPMEPYFSVLALTLVFWASAALQIYFAPYATSTLHMMHLLSTSCLAATTFGALAMFAYDVQAYTAEMLRYVIASLLLFINVVFVGWCCLKLFAPVKQWCIAAASAARVVACRMFRRFCASTAACIGWPAQKQQKAAAHHRMRA